MARIRSVKPELFIHDKLNECSLPARYLFIGLFCHCDSEGVCKNRPKILKPQIFPYDDYNIYDLILELERNGFIVTFKHNNDPYLWIVNFKKHQYITAKEKMQERLYPPPPALDRIRNVSGTVPDTTQIGYGSDGMGIGGIGLGEIEIGNRTGGEGKENSASPPPASETQTPKQPPDEPPEPKPPSALEQFVIDWNEAADRAGWPPIRKMTDARKNQFRLRSKDEFWISHYRQAIEKADRIPGLCGRNDREWRMDVDFFLRPDTVAKIVEGKYDNWGTGKPKAETPRRGFENIDERIARQLAEALEYHAGQNQEALQNGETDSEIPAIKYGT